MDEHSPPRARVRDAAAQADALRALHDRHAAGLWRFVVSLTGSTADADDVVQETLVRVWRQPHLLAEEPDAVRAWLFTVARNLVIDRARSARSRHERTVERMVEAPPDDHTDRVLDRLLLQDAVASLAPHHREVIVRAYYGGCTTAEVAAELGIAEGTVKSRLHYGVRALRLAFQERGVTR